MRCATRSVVNASLCAVASLVQLGPPALLRTTGRTATATHLSKEMAGCFGWIVTVYGLDEKSVLVDDLGKKPFLLSRDQLTAARGRIGSYKNRLLVVDPPDDPMIDRAIIAGIRDCVEQLAGPSETFGLKALVKWSKMMTDKRGKKGWPTVFDGGVGLYGALVSIHEAICHLGTDGAGLRSMYADFLTEAARVLDDKALQKVSRKYRAVAKHWSRLAEIVLPAEIFSETLDLIEKKHVILRTKGQTGLEELERYSSRLENLRVGYNKDCPLGPNCRAALFAELSEQLMELYRVEVDAIQLLEEAVAQHAPS